MWDITELLIVAVRIFQCPYVPIFQCPIFSRVSNFLDDILLQIHPYVMIKLSTLCLLIYLLCSALAVIFGTLFFIFLTHIIIIF